MLMMMTMFTMMTMTMITKMKTNLKDNILASSQLHHHVPGLPVHVPSLQPDGDDIDDEDDVDDVDGDNDRENKIMSMPIMIMIRIKKMLAEKMMGRKATHHVAGLPVHIPSLATR